MDLEDELYEEPKVTLQAIYLICELTDGVITDIDVNIIPIYNSRYRNKTVLLNKSEGKIIYLDKKSNT